MGGRGSYSYSYSAKNSIIRNAGISLHGGNSAFTITSILENQDQRKDVNDISSLAGFTGGSYGTDAIDTQSMSAYMLHLNRLEKEYGALGAVPTSIHGATGRGFLAAAGGDGKGNAVLLLHVGKMKNAAYRAKSEITAQRTHHHMQTDGRLTSRAGYTVTHEYGHLVQHPCIKKLLKMGILELRKLLDGEHTETSHLALLESMVQQVRTYRITESKMQRNFSLSHLPTLILARQTHSAGLCRIISRRTHYGSFGGRQ